jgi:hypothetical protein
MKIEALRETDPVLTQTIKVRQIVFIFLPGASKELSSSSA